MNANEINAAIANELGRRKQIVPDFCGSLDACAMFEVTLTSSEIATYQMALRYVAREGCASDWKMITATASQRCEAFLKVKGLWK